MHAIYLVIEKGIYRHRIAAYSGMVAAMQVAEAMQADSDHHHDFEVVRVTLDVVHHPPATLVSGKPYSAGMYPEVILRVVSWDEKAKHVVVEDRL